MRHVRMAVLSATLAASGGSATACEHFYAYNYQTTDAVYTIELNGVFLDREAEPSGFSGSGTFRQWTLEGENELTVTIDEGEAEFRLFRACAGNRDGSTLLQASLKGPETRTLLFYIEGAPKAIYSDLPPLKEDGLKEAIDELKTATKVRDVDSFWRLQEGLRIQGAEMGMQEDQMRAMLSETVEDGEATFRDDLVFEPVLGGRVWQVMTADREAPVTITLDGGRRMEVGAYWTKINGEWRVAGR